MAKKKTVRKSTKAKRAGVKSTRKTTRAVAFYKQPVAAISNGFDRVFSFFK